MSTIAERHPSATRAANKRAFLAGSAATAALIAAAALVFISLAAYVAFNGIPAGGGEQGVGFVAIDSNASSAGAPEAAASALAGAPAAVATTPAASTPIALTPPGPGGGGTVSTPGSQGSVIVGGVEIGPGGQTPVSAPDSKPGVLGSAMDEIEQTADPMIDTPSGNVTDGVAGPLDDVLEQALDGVGAALGNPQLGD